jgi:hypothetical protein
MSNNVEKVNNTTDNNKWTNTIFQSLKPGQLMMVAGRPNRLPHGAPSDFTSFENSVSAGQIAFDAIRQGYAVIFFYGPYYAFDDNIFKWFHPNLKAEIQKYESAKYSLFIDAFDVDEIKWTVRNYWETLPDEQNGMIIVDYLENLPETDYIPNRTRQEMHIDNARELKNIAKDMSIPVVAVLEPKRADADSTDSSPKLSDLPPDLAQEADVVVLLDRGDDTVSGGTDSVRAIIAMSLNGETGVGTQYDKTQEAI